MSGNQPGQIMFQQFPCFSIDGGFKKEQLIVHLKLAQSLNNSINMARVAPVVDTSKEFNVVSYSDT